MERQREHSLLCWINVHWTINQIEEFRRVQTLILFLQSLFHSVITSEHIPTLLNELKLPIPFDTIPIDETAYLNGDKSQIINLFDFIQRQYQAYFIQSHLLSNTDLTFSKHVNTLFIYLYFYLLFV